MKICVSVGHTLTGADYGATKYLTESKETRIVGDKVCSLLKSKGHEVILARIDNATTVLESLGYRTNIANNAGVDLFIEIHFNAGGGTGTETYVSGLGGQAEKYGRNIVNSIAELGFQNRGLKTGNFYVLKNTVAPAVLIECCFVDSKSDYERYNADKMAQKIVKGIIGEEVIMEENKLEYTHIAIEGVNIVDDSGEYTGALYVGERCQLRWIDNQYRKYVRYLNYDGTQIKEGYVESSKSDKVISIEDAYDFYNAVDYDVIVKEDEGYQGKDTGLIYSNEKVKKISSNKLGNSLIAYDNAQGEKLAKIGYVPTSVLRDINSPKPDIEPEKPIEPPVVEDKKYLYIVEVLSTTDQEKAESIKNKMLELGFVDTKIVKKEIKK